MQTRKEAHGRSLQPNDEDPVSARASAAPTELFPGSARHDAIAAASKDALAACLLVGRALAGRGGAIRSMQAILIACRTLADLVDAPEPRAGA